MTRLEIIVERFAIGVALTLFISGCGIALPAIIQGYPA